MNIDIHIIYDELNKFSPQITTTYENLILIIVRQSNDGAGIY